MSLHVSWCVRGTWPLGLPLTTIKSCDWTSVRLPLTDTWRHDWINPLKTTKLDKCLWCQKSVGLVSPDANPGPNPWGQKLPIDPAGHPQGEGWYHTHPRGVDPNGCLYQTASGLSIPSHKLSPESLLLCVIVPRIDQVCKCTNPGVILSK
jgi:hypothetical protein